MANALRSLHDLLVEVNGHLAQSLPAPADGGAGDFHHVWSEAKPLLQSAAGVVSLVPGAGVKAGAALGALLLVGDQLAALPSQDAAAERR